MALGEALARCPTLELVAADPVAVAAAWERDAARARGDRRRRRAARPGLACFALDGLRGLHGGSDELVLAAARRALDRPARLAAAPTRFCALAAALATRPPAHADRPRRARARTSRRCRSRCCARAAVTEPLVGTLERLGIATLGELAALGARRARRPLRAPPASRPTGSPAARTTRPARGRVEARCEESLELPESAGGPVLERALGRADRPPAGAPGAARAHAAGGDARRAPRRRRQLAQQRHLPRGARRARSGCASRSSRASRCCPRPRERADARRRALRAARRRAARAARPGARATAARGCARRSRRCAAPPEPTPRCASTGSSPTRASPSGA